MLIVDDERIIRETISQHIDWAALDIEIIGTAGNGIEAYDLIMDEYPDIVMTDIKMPGFSGLELLQRIKTLHADVEFIILSGYGEFEYAQAAMQWGVRHYLLKPCSDEQIIASVRDVIDEISARRTSEAPAAAPARQEIGDSAILNLLNECIARGDNEGDPDYGTIYTSYEQFLDFRNTPYELCFEYFLEPASLQAALDQIHVFRERFSPGIPFYAVYVEPCLLLFFQSYHLQYETLDTYLSALRLPEQGIAIEYRRVHYANLAELMNYINRRVCHFATVRYSAGGSVITICNYRNIIRQVERATLDMFDADETVGEAGLQTLCEITSHVTETNFLKQLVSTIMMLASSRCISYTSLEASEFLMRINEFDTCEEILGKLVPQLHMIYARYASTRVEAQSLSERIKAYVAANLANDELSLKMIADTYLYMNVDYVSRRFQKETGQRFSSYLTSLRIQRAIDLLKDADNDKVQTIAEQVGFGNNPQYFSHVFKKATGMTPSAYIKYSAGGNA